MEPYIPEELSDRQCAVVGHYVKVLNADINRMRYVKNEKKLYEVFPIDIAIFEPTDVCDFYTIATVGLSEYRFNNTARAELLLAVPKIWKPILDKEEYYWIPEFLQDIAFQLAVAKAPVKFGQVFVYDKEDRPGYSPFTDAMGGIVALPEDFPIEMFEEEIGESFTRFFELVILNEDDISKVDEQGVQRFIKYELHDSEGPLFQVKFNPPKPEGIEKIIEHNKASLYDNSKKDD